MADPLNQAVRRWMFEDALPFWAEHGVDRAFGGYVEQLRLDGSDGAVDFRRVRVIARQIYVFSHAALMGHRAYGDLARRGYYYLIGKAWQGPHLGWARLLDRQGRVKDATPDLYDHAFVLFALGWYYRLDKDADVLRWSLSTLDFIDTHMRHSGGRGYFAEVPASGHRKQNPHMHLLEAALVNLEASGDGRFLTLANEMVALFCDHFYDGATQTLGEYFDDSWGRATGDAGRMVEPGHHFEWAWLLAGYQRIVGRDMREFVRGLIAFAEAHGVDRHSHATFNVVRDDGLVLDGGSRTWPNAERIQAAVALFELEGRDPRPMFEQSGRLLLDRYLSHAPRGTWIDHFAADGTPLADTIPASTLYHVFLAFAEMLRVEDQVARAFAK
jgi:mannose/cellobiose epimerase-like protein (N-acyl-D-glucosamine 2-epimerase family)